MKVKNPNPCLVNVVDKDGKFVRIGPNQVADVDAKSVERLLKSGALVKATAADEQPADASEDTEQATTPAASKTANKK